MRFTITAPDITPPTYQTLEEYSIKRFEKIKKYLKKTDQTDHEVRIAVEKEHDHFDLTAEIFIREHIAVTVKDRDLRKAIDSAVDMIIRRLKDIKERKIDKGRKRDKVMDQLKRLRDVF